jgi:hypothetical protein
MNARLLGIVALCLLAAHDLTAQIIKPNLTVTSLTPPSSVKAGTTVKVGIKVKQHKILTSSAACKAGIYLSPDSKITTKDTLIGVASVPKLGYQATASGTVSCGIPNGAAQGTCYIGAIVDYTGVVAETSESDNTKAVKVTCISRKPDLIITALASSRTVLTSGQKADFTTTVKNQGEVTSSSSAVVYYYLSVGDTVLNTGDRLVGSGKISALAVNSSAPFKHTVTIPSAITGTNICYLIAKVNAATLELSTGNNERTIPVTSKPVPDQTARFTLNGDSAADYMGYSVSSAGDVNGDGYDDIIAGARGDDNNGTDSGSARIYDGHTGGVIRTLYGDSAGDTFGFSVAGVGDVNGDGFDDVLVGAPLDDNNGASSGMARLFSGRNGAILRSHNGFSAGDYFGYSVSGAGDVDGDGYDDYIVGAPLRYTNAGQAYTYSGRTGALLLTLSGGSNDRLGHAVSGAGDIDQDGFDDVIVGAPYDTPGSGLTSAGSAYVYSVKKRSLLAWFKGDTASDLLGFSVAGAGDINKDGYPDVAIGVPYDDLRGTNSGSVRVYSGQNLQLLRILYGYAAGDLMGYRVSGAGDVNGDGHDDIIGGAPTADPRGSSSGRAIVMSGKNGAILFDFVGETAGDYLGFSVASIGDTNYDGLPDLVVGAYGDDNNGSASGSVRVFQSSGLSGVARTRTYGHACQSSSNNLPRINCDDPVLGQNIRLRLSAAPAATTASINLAVSRSSLTLAPMGAPGCTAWVLPLASLKYTTLTDGTAQLASVTPNNNNLIGVNLYAQWWMLDAKANALGLIVSKGLQLTIGK